MSEKDSKKVYLVSHHELERGYMHASTPGFDRWERFADFYKIGIAGNPEKRLSTMSSGTPHRLKLVTTIEADDARRVESALHNLYYPVQHNGEWFSLDSNSINSLIALDTISADNIEPLVRQLGRIVDTSLYVELMKERQYNTPQHP